MTFVEMGPADGEYEPLIRYIVLEQSQAAIDMLGHRQVPIKQVVMQFECGTRILRVIHGRDARATLSNCTTTHQAHGLEVISFKH